MIEMVAQANLLRSRQFYMTVALLGQVKLLPSLISNFCRALVDRSIDPVSRLCHAGGSNPRKHLSRQYNVLSSLRRSECSERRLVVVLCTELV
jgi:hypothetical protein